MSDDPRWQILADLVERATAPDSAADSGEFARRFEEFLATAEAIAEDQAAAAEDRAVARKILVRIDGAMRARCSSVSRSVIAVAIMPGAMQLTVMPRVATSAATDFAMPIIAALAAA